MSLGPHLTDEVVQCIAEVVDENPDWVAKQVHAAVNQRLGGYGPGLSAVQKKMKILRERINKEKGKGLEEPWCLGSSVKFSIPTESMGDLVRIWKWCLAVGKPFTNREAQWVSRLRGIVPFERLLLEAAGYARRERAYKMLGRDDIKTYDLDAGIALVRTSKLGIWSYGTAMKTAAVLDMWPDDIGQIGTDKETVQATGDRALEFDMAYSASENVLESLNLESIQRELDGEEDLVFAIWLRTLARGDDWSYKDSEEKMEIAQQLYDEVRRFGKEIRSEMHLYQSDGEKGLDKKTYFKAAGWEPSVRLFRAVGYRVKQPKRFKREKTVKKSKGGAR